MTEPGFWNILSAQEKNAICITIISGLQMCLAAQHLFPHFLVAEPQVSFERFPSLILVLMVLVGLTPYLCSTNWCVAQAWPNLGQLKSGQVFSWT